MSTVDERIREILLHLNDLDKQDITHVELGTVSGFHEAQDAKTKACEYLKDLLIRLEKQQKKFNAGVVNEKLGVIAQWATQVSEQSGRIDNLAKSGVHESNFPGQRSKLISAIVTQSENIQKNVHLLEVDVKLAELGESLKDKGHFEELKAGANDAVRKAEESSRAIEKILASVQQKTVLRGVEESAGQFGDLVEHHKVHEIAWFIASVISAIVLCASIIYIVWFDPTAENANVVVGLIKRIVLVSAAGIFLRITLVKYSVERALRIVYGHRQKVLDQYRTFEAGIGDDLDAKNQFRLEIAKYIFSDPQISSGGSRSTAEININPVVSAAERLTRQKS